MGFFDSILLKKSAITLTKEQIAELLKVSPEALAAFEEAYKNVQPVDGEYYSANAKEAAAYMASINSAETTDELEKIKNNIVADLVNNTQIYTYLNGKCYTKKITLGVGRKYTAEELNLYPVKFRPMVASDLMVKDISGDESSAAVLFNYKQWKETGNKQFYYMFRQGLDILDLDPILYEMLSMNPNSMGYWLPNIATTVDEEGFFKIPNTTIVKVPLTLLQLTRITYETINQTTFDIVNEYCRIVFNLHPNGDYFIKTGTFSSKYDFRNAHVYTPEEVNELGQYLLYIQNQAVTMAGGLSGKSIYGVSTTNEWVVREFIKDTENNGEIYHGLPLHTEYRVFVDFDLKKVMGISPYWEPTVMKNRFSKEADADTADMKHDYISYCRMEETLMARYEANKDTVIEHMNNWIKNSNMTGQWSIDIMQNGEDFWLIDMALAENSALNECVKNQLRPVEENWLPNIRRFIST